MSSDGLLQGAGNLSSIGAVVVTYHPDLQSFRRLLQALPSEVRLAVVDNASASTSVECIKQLLAVRPGASLVSNDRNLGLAAALNQGAAELQNAGAEFLLLLDQDSIPRAGALTALLEALLKLEARGVAVGCVGPRLIDPVTTLEHGFHTMRGIRWTRVFPKAGDWQPVQCANLNGSGTLVRSAVFTSMGGLDESLFIDHVDTDWSFRILEAGMVLFGIPDAVFDHSMGERGMRFWFLGWRVWPVRSPSRHFFLFRNSVVLLRRSYVPRLWKSWAIVKLVSTLAIYVLLDARRWQQAKSMFNGVRQGLVPMHKSSAWRPARWSRGSLEYLDACPICGSDSRDGTPRTCSDHRGAMAAERWLIQRCTNCKSLYLDPRPDDTSLALAYDDYYTHTAEKETVPASGIDRWLWALIHGYLNEHYGFSRKPAWHAGSWLFRLLPPLRLKLDYYARHLSLWDHPRKGRLLDVGCGNGAFLARAKEMGWEAIGLDPDPAAVRACRDQGLDAREGTTADLPDEIGNDFDVITFSHSIEHVHDIRAALRGAGMLLASGGTLWMAFPNPSALGARVFRGAWRELHPPYHLCIPSQRAMRQLLQECGFKRIRFIRRGSHARRMMRESAENARIAGGAGMVARALIAPMLRVIADILATVSPRFGEETVVIAERAST